jgi:prepilin-type processing-associated H-X9-DG protein
MCCGHNALYLAVHLANGSASMARIDELLTVSESGVNLANLKSAAATIGVYPVAVRHGADSPLCTDVPSMLALRGNSGSGHYVVAYGTIGNKVRVVDFPRTLTVDEATLRSKGIWDGTAVYVFGDRERAEQFARTFASIDRVNHIRTTAALIGMAALFLTISLLRKDARREELPIDRRARACGSPGATLLELLVCISIVGLLVSLTLPAVQRARESQRALECRNRLKQLGVGMQAFHEVYRTFPPGGLLSRIDASRPGSERPSRFSAFAYLLPHVEESGLFNSINFEIGLDFGRAVDPLGTKDIQRTAIERTVDLFLCPSDISGQRPGTSYRLNIGVGAFHRAGMSPDAGNGAFGANALGARDFTDGLSNTVAISEKARGDCRFGTYNPVSDFFYVPLSPALPTTADDFLQTCASASVYPPPFDCNAGRYWIYAGLSNSWYNHAQEPNGEVPDCGLEKIHPTPGLFTARSYHNSRIHILMADGSVRAVQDRIDRSAWRALGTRNGSEALNDSEW